MNRKEERKLEAKIKKEQGSEVDAENLSAEIINAIPNERDRNGNYDAVNADLTSSQVKGTHETNINQHTDLELGGLADPGGLDPALDREFMRKMKQDKNEQ